MNSNISTISELKAYQTQLPQDKILAVSQVLVSDLTPEVMGVPFFGNDSIEREDLQQWFAHEEWKEELLFVEPFTTYPGLRIFGVRRRVFETLERLGVPLYVQCVGRAITPLVNKNDSYSEAELDYTYIADSDHFEKIVDEAFTLGVYRYLADVFSSSEPVSLEKLRQELQYASQQVSAGRPFKCLHNMLQVNLEDSELKLTLSLMTEFFDQEQIDAWKDSFLYERQLNSQSQYVKMMSGVL